MLLSWSRCKSGLHPSRRCQDVLTLDRYYSVFSRAQGYPPATKLPLWHKCIGKMTGLSLSSGKKGLSYFLRYVQFWLQQACRFYSSETQWQNLTLFSWFPWRRSRGAQFSSIRFEACSAWSLLCWWCTSCLLQNWGVPGCVLEAIGACSPRTAVWSVLRDNLRLPKSLWSCSQSLIDMFQVAGWKHSHILSANAAVKAHR